MVYSILDTVKETESLLATNDICKKEVQKVIGLRKKLENKEMTISVIGQFKRGKSTLVNSILEDEILPVGIIPVTSVVTTIRYGEKSAEVRFENGDIKEVEFDQLSKYINEQENSNNILGVSSVDIHTPSDFLKDGLVFVDTPGVGSAHKHNSDIAYSFMKESDAVIFMLSVDSPINEIEIDFLRNTREYAAKFYFTVNKIDIVSEEELSSYMKYCEDLLSRLMDVESVQMFPVSARSGRGIGKLAECIEFDCKNEIVEILENSVARKLKDTITCALSQLDLYWKALNMPTRELTEKFDKMSVFLEEIKSKSKDIVLDWDGETELEIYLNEMKLQLTTFVEELFSIEYHYEIEDSKTFAKGKSNKEFLQEVQLLCKDLESNLNGILLYREEDAYTVVRKISDLNKLTRKLRKINNTLISEMEI
ncbi:MAG: dynamin family protein [Anaerovoracaceae bacterium]